MTLIYKMGLVCCFTGLLFTAVFADFCYSFPRADSGASNKLGEDFESAYQRSYAYQEQLNSLHSIGIKI